MKVIDCDCGTTLSAANDDDLLAEMRAHADESHSEEGFTNEQLQELVSSRAYEASDS